MATTAAYHLAVRYMVDGTPVERVEAVDVWDLPRALQLATMEGGVITDLAARLVKADQRPPRQSRPKMLPNVAAGTETDWQRTVVEALEFFGWAVQHVRPGMTRSGRWRTQTTSSGWPDLVALRGPWLLAIECKGYQTPVDDDQLAWLARFAALPCARAWLLRPTVGWQHFTDWLQHPEGAPLTFGWDLTSRGLDDPTKGPEE